MERASRGLTAAWMPNAKCLRRASKPRSKLNSLFHYVPQQIGHAIAVAPFVVVPADQFEKPFVQLNARAFIINRGGIAVNEIAADHFVLGRFQDSLEVSLAGPLQRFADLSVTGVATRSNGKVDAGDGRSGNPKSH